MTEKNGDALLAYAEGRKAKAYRALAARLGICIWMRKRGPESMLRTMKTARTCEKEYRIWVRSVR